MRKHWGRIAAILGLLIVVVFPGWSSGQVGQAGASATVKSKVDWAKIKVAYQQAMDSHEFFNLVQAGVKKAVAARGGTLIVGPASNQDAQTIRDTTENFLIQGVKYFVDMNQVSEVWDGGYSQNVTDRGMKIIAVGQKMKDPVYNYGPDQTIQGQVSGQVAIDYIKKNWGGKLDYFLNMYLQSFGETQWGRNKAWEAQLKQNFPSVTKDQIVWLDVTSGQDILNNCMTTVRDFLTAHPNAHKVYLSCHADVMALAALSAIEQLGRLDDVIIVSVDCSAAAITKMKQLNGKCFLADTYDDPVSYGEAICTYIEEIEQGTAQMVKTHSGLACTMANIYQLFPTK